MSIETQTASPDVAAFPWLAGQDGNNMSHIDKSEGNSDSGIGVEDSGRRDSKMSEDFQKPTPVKQNNDDTATSTTITSLLNLLQTAFADENGKKQLYDAALNLAYSIESPQDTAQRLYHGVSV